MDRHVTLYALKTCPYCQAIKKMLTDLHVEHDYIEADSLEGEKRAAVLEELAKFNPKCSFPTTVIDQQVVLGYQVQDIKERLGIRKEVDDLYDTLRRLNEKKGYYFNDNKEQTYQLLRGLITNKNRYGYMSCPCRLASGKRDMDRDIICPCNYREQDVKEFGSCFCGLYVSEAWNSNTVVHRDVPERRNTNNIEND